MDKEKPLIPDQLAERRSQQAKDCRKWSPRDALLAAIRDIDKGEINPNMLVIHYREPGDNEFEVRYGYFAAGVTTIEHAGLLAMGMKRVAEQ